MSAENGQKLKLLHLLRILWTKTDAQRGVSMAQIITELNEVGIKAERKSIYRDIAALREFGLEVVTYKRMPVEYALVKTGFSFDDVMMLVDVVQGSKFLSEHKSTQLVKSVQELASVHERGMLKKRVHVEGRIKNQNESVFHNVDTIHQAIAQKRKIQFLYCRYGTDLEMHPTQDPETGRARLYVETPVKVAFVNGFYYVAVWSDLRNKMLTFRVDRKKLLQVSNQKATRNETISSYAYEHFEYQAFEMFDGKPVNVTLQVNASGMGVIVDRFGRDVVVTNTTQNTCDVHVTVRMSPLFHGWLASMNDIIQLTAPKSAVEAHKAWLKALLE